MLTAVQRPTLQLQPSWTPSPSMRLCPWPRRTTSATLPAKSTPALDPVHRDQVALIVPTYVARPAARAQEDAVRRQDAKIPRVAASISSTLGMTPEPALDSSSDRVDAYNLRRCRDSSPRPP
jgi:hypothetical protein